MDESTPPDRGSTQPLEYHTRRLKGDRGPLPVLPLAQRRRLIWRRIRGFVLVLLILALFGYFFHRYYAPRHAAALRRECAANFTTIARACAAYTDLHNGKFPANFQDMLTSTGVTSDAFVCPATDDEPADGTLPDQLAELATPGHVSYIWVGKDMPTNAKADMILAYEPLENHNYAGMHVLYKDYRVEWLDAQDARKLLKAIGNGDPAMWPLPDGK